MFPRHFFAGRFFAARFFPQSAGVAPPPPGPVTDPARVWSLAPPALTWAPGGGA